MQIKTFEGGDLNVEIREIKLRSFIVNELAYIAQKDKLIKIEISQHIGFSVEHELANLVLTVFLFYEDNPENKLSQIEVENVFFVKDLKSFMQGEDVIKLPLEFYLIIFNEAIPQTRALFSQSLKGTIFSNILLQISNSANLVGYFFPNLRELINNKFPNFSPIMQQYTF